MDLAHDGHRRPGARGGERGALAGQSGADDEDVMCGHGGRVYIGYGPARPAGQRGGGGAGGAAAPAKAQRAGNGWDGRGPAERCLARPYLYPDRAATGPGAKTASDRSARREVGLQRARDLLERDDAAQAALAVDRHQGAEAPQRLGAQQRLQRRVGPHLALPARGDDQLAHRPVAGAALGDLAQRLAVGEADVAAVRLDDREPLPALVAQEEVLVGARRPAGRRGS